jgi:hypothetical protein
LNISTSTNHHRNNSKDGNQPRPRSRSSNITKGNRANNNKTI